MKIFPMIMLMSVLIVPVAALSEIHPKFYRIDQDAAPEYLGINVLTVKTGLNPLFRVKQVTIKAEIKEIVRSAEPLNVGDIIMIKYDHFSPRKGWVGPRPIPILKRGCTYPAFLKRSEDGNHYIPAARGASFEPLIHY